MCDVCDGRGKEGEWKLACLEDGEMAMETGTKSGGRLWELRSLTGKSFFLGDFSGLSARLGRGVAGLVGSGAPYSAHVPVPSPVVASIGHMGLTLVMIRILASENQLGTIATRDGGYEEMIAREKKI